MRKEWIELDKFEPCSIDIMNAYYTADFVKDNKLEDFVDSYPHQKYLLMMRKMIHIH